MSWTLKSASHYSGKSKIDGRKEEMSPKPSNNSSWLGAFSIPPVYAISLRNPDRFFYTGWNEKHTDQSINALWRRNEKNDTILSSCTVMENDKVEYLMRLNILASNKYSQHKRDNEIAFLTWIMSVCLKNNWSQVTAFTVGDKLRFSWVAIQYLRVYKQVSDIMDLVFES